MPTHTVLDVGNCAPDHASIKRMLVSHFDVEVLQTHAGPDTLDLLRQRSVDLVLINRKLDCDYSDGTEILKQLKADPLLAKTPVMIISNYAEHQDAAVAMGAEPGFGKLELQDPATPQKLSEFLA
ncbi:MAG: response regulator [Planctomycetales bacterium]|nr:response regulator [Planctomycetales bacterium]